MFNRISRQQCTFFQYIYMRYKLSNIHTSIGINNQATRLRPVGYSCFCFFISEYVSFLVKIKGILASTCHYIIIKERQLASNMDVICKIQTWKNLIFYNPLCCTTIHKYILNIYNCRHQTEVYVFNH